MSPLLWLLVPAAPLLGGLLVLGYRPQQSARWLWLCCLPALLLCLWPAPPLILPILWPGAEWGLLDNLDRSWLGFTALLWACASRYAATDLLNDQRRRRFWLFWSLALSGNLLLIIAQDAGSFYVGFTLMSLAAYGLVAHQPGSEPRQAARLYLQLAVLGEMLIYAGIMLRIEEAGGALALGAWQNAPGSGWSSALLLIGFGLKAGFWPLHIWLPLAHPAAPAAASAVLSGAMIKAGILGAWRFLPAGPGVMQDWIELLMAVGAFGALYAVALGVIQQRSKTLLAYSSISQMGYLLIILALAWQQPGQRDTVAVMLGLYATHHALAKGALFMGAGLGMRVAFNRWHWLLLSLPALALAGLPLTSGAAVKLLFKDGIADSDQAGWMWLLTIGSVGTMLLMLRFLWLMRASQQQRELAPMPASQRAPWAILCVMPVLLPWLWQPLRQAILDSLPLYAIWAALWPALIALAVSALVLKMGWHLPARLQQLPYPARAISLGLRRLTQRPPVPEPARPLNESIWRRRERRWNRLWGAGTVATSAWLIILLLLLGW